MQQKPKNVSFFLGKAERPYSERYTLHFFVTFDGNVQIILSLFMCLSLGRVRTTVI